MYFFTDFIKYVFFQCIGNERYTSLFPAHMFEQCVFQFI